jgi:acetoin utilization deacetylase AcuC-like enzyme
MASLLLYTHPSGMAHDPGPGHPEAPVRLKVIREALAKAAIPGLEEREAPQASLEQLARVHPEPYAPRLLASVPTSGYARIDADTVMSPASGEAALRAAGAACAAVDALLAGESARAFVAMRPPGHHAEPDRVMGFCLFNTIAIAAMQARAVHGLKRLAILDFDVHHGNGTQAVFWDDPDTLYLSTHQWPLYPGTGAARERGAHGNIRNIPLAPGTDGLTWRLAVEREVLPAIDAWRPELILLSAGFDAHAADPLASLGLREDDFAWIAEAIAELADRHAQGRILATLEGGYDPPALARSVTAFVRALAKEGA